AAISASWRVCVTAFSPCGKGGSRPRSIVPQASTSRRCAMRSAVEMKRTARRWKLAGQMPLISLIVLCAATALLTNRFLSPFNLTNILVQCSIMAVIAMGMTFVIVGGGFDLSVGSTAGLSGGIAGMGMPEAGIAAGGPAGGHARAAARPAHRAG